MARASHTPITFWLELPINSFYRWIRSANEVEAEDKAEADRQSRK